MKWPVSIYSPSVSLVLCELLNVMVVCRVGNRKESESELIKFKRYSTLVVCLPVVVGLLFVLVFPLNTCT